MIQLFRQYVSIRKWLLIAFQTVLFAGCLCAAVVFRFWADRDGLQEYTTLPGFAVRLACFVAGVQACFLLSEYYDRNQALEIRDEFALLSKAVGCAGIFLGSMYFVFPFLLVGRGVFFISLGMIAATSLLSRTALNLNWQFTKPQRILILGTGELAQLAARGVEARNDLNLLLAGFLTEDFRGPTASQVRFEDSILGPMWDIESIVANNGISRIVVAMEERRGGFPAAELVRLKVSGIKIEDVHSTLAALTGHIWLRAVRPSSFVFSDGFRRSKLTTSTKRVLDLLLASSGFALSLPVMIVLAAIIKLESPGRVLYRQTRVGWKGRTFDVLKLRSMRNDAEADGAKWAVANDPRVTRVGGFLRKYRLDELPQFINIIRGDMSFVGPRPERPRFVDELRHAIPYYDERHSIRPGLTGWAQIRYGYGATVVDATRKLEYDLFYLQNMSLLFDCAIVLNTIRTVLSGFERKSLDVFHAEDWMSMGADAQLTREEDLSAVEAR